MAQDAALIKLLSFNDAIYLFSTLVIIAFVFIFGKLFLLVSRYIMITNIHNIKKRLTK